MKLWDDKLFFLGRVFLGLIFAYSGYTKLMEPVENFRGAMAAYEIIPYFVIPLLAYVIPWIEFIFGIFLLLGYLSRVSALVLAGMSASFVLLILITKIVTGIVPADCGCFGEGSLIHLSAAQVFFMDILNTFIGVRLAFFKNPSLSLDSLLKRETGPGNR